MTGHIPAPGRPLVVEISLKTAEGDSLVLEWWRLAVVAGGDPMVRRSFISRYKFILLFFFLLIILL